MGQRADSWYAVQRMLPPPPHFESRWRQFLRDLPAGSPLSTQQFAKLAYFAGVFAAFEALTMHDKCSTEFNFTDEQNFRALKELALEPVEYLHRRGVKLP